MPHDDAVLLNNLLTKSCYSRDPIFSPILSGDRSAACVYGLDITNSILAEKAPRENCYGKDT
jgi:hypothetical protein